MVKLVDNEFESLNIPFTNGISVSNISEIVPLEDTMYVLSNDFGMVAGFEGYGGAKYDGEQWYPIILPYCCSHQTYTDFVKYDGELYISGNFSGNPPAWDLAKLVDEEWTLVGQGIAGAGLAGIYGMEVYDSELYVFGTFKRNAGNAGEGIMKWNGEEWSDLGTGVTDGVVTDAVVFQDELFICGVFTEAGGIPVQGVAKWDGGQWCSVGSNFYFSNVQKMTVYHDELYIFSREELGYSSLYKWNGDVDTCSVEFNRVDEIALLEELEVYPNPTKEKLTVLLPENMSGNISLTIYDGLGKEVLKFTELLNSKNQLEVSLVNLPSGLYSIQFRHEEVVGFAKFIKE